MSQKMADGRRRVALNLKMVIARLGAEEKLEARLSINDVTEELTKAKARMLIIEQAMVNTPSPGFLLFTKVKVGDHDVMQGAIMDGWCWNANNMHEGGLGCSLGKGDEISVEAHYTGLVPAPLSGEGPYIVALTLFGAVVA